MQFGGMRKEPTIAGSVNEMGPGVLEPTENVNTDREQARKLRADKK